MKVRISMAFVALAFAASPVWAEDAACPKEPKGIYRTHGTGPYPIDSFRRGEQGTVILTVHLGKDGSPATVDISHSSGASSLDYSAKNYIEHHWRWEPQQAGCPPFDPFLIGAIFAIGPVPSPSSRPPTDADLTMSAPAFPPGAWERFEQGNTFLNVMVDGEGSIVDAHLVLSSGYKDLDDQAAIVLKAKPGIMKDWPAGMHNVVVVWPRPNMETISIRAQRCLGSPSACSAAMAAQAAAAAAAEAAANAKVTPDGASH